MDCRRCGQPARSEFDLGIAVCKHCGEAAELLELIDQVAAARAAAVVPHLETIAAISRMVDRLGELHAVLSVDDRLQQVLHSLSFTWGYVESELTAAARPRRN